MGTVNSSENFTAQTDAELQINLINQKLETINSNLNKVMNGIKLLYSKIEKTD